MGLLKASNERAVESLHFTPIKLQEPLGKVGKNTGENYRAPIMLVVGIMKIIKLVNCKNTFGLGWLKMDMTNKIFLKLKQVLSIYSSSRL